MNISPYLSHSTMDSKIEPFSESRKPDRSLYINLFMNQYKNVPFTNVLPTLCEFVTQLFFLSLPTLSGEHKFVKFRHVREIWSKWKRQALGACVNRTARTQQVTPTALPHTAACHPLQPLKKLTTSSPHNFIGWL